MEEEALKKLYQDYLELVYETSKYEYGEKKETRDLVFPRRFKVEYVDNDSIIKDIATDQVVTVLRNKKVSEEIFPGLFGVEKEERDKSWYDYSRYYYYIDYMGRKVKPLKKSLNTSREYTCGISRTRFRKEGKYFFNDLTREYEPLVFDPLVFEYEYEYGPHADFTGQMAIHMENQYYKLFIGDDKRVFLYRKALGTYEELAYNKVDKQNSSSEKGFIALDINFDRNIMKINDTYYYMTPFDVVDISGMMKNKRWSRSIRITPVKEKIMSYDFFKTNMKKNKDFWDLLVKEINELKQKKYIEDLENAQRIKEQEELLRMTQRAKELWQKIFDAMKELKELGDLSIVGRIKVDEDLLFIKIGDHLEFNPVFINYLSLIDFSLISFKNVKVSGLDFSGSNAFIDPQIVYDKDMSNGNYSGLDFNSASFNGVNICGSSFIDCPMDFTDFEGALKDDDTVIEGSYTF